MSTNGDYNDSDHEFQDDHPLAETGNLPSKSLNDSWLSLEIYIKANQPELLTGLEQWLQLDLISQGQVKKLCRNHLSCALPKVEVVKAIPIVENIVEETTNKSLVIAASSPKAPNILSRIVQGFLDELSIRWLLFLGIFLVVISSGVLAASQWQNFPGFGQYLVLLIYTLSFWGIGWWTGQQENLKLTSQTLSAIAILLVPINFWAMSHLGLGNKPTELIIIAVATLVLTTIFWLSNRRKQASNNIIWSALFLFLSYLHLGWQLPYLPLFAIYGGIIVISLLNYQLLLKQVKYPVVDLLFILASWSLLLARILITNLDLTRNYSMAIAILGWLLATIYLTQTNQIKENKIPNNQQSNQEITNLLLGKICQIFSIIIFVITWIISIVAGILSSSLFFWQTVGISGLALHLFSQRLTLYWRKRDLTAIFLLGLQTLYISKELIPDSLRNQALDISITISKTEYLPESVFAVTLFPYVIIFVLIASWLYHEQKTQLALYGEYLTLMLGIGLTCLSLTNPTWRSLNLLLSTVTLAYVAKIRQPIRVNLIYGTHLLGLITIINGIDFAFPNLTTPLWGITFITLMLIEWGIHLRQLKQKLEPTFSFLLWQSCWYFGLLLSVVSYTCFVAYIDSSSLSANSFRYGLIWLITPGMLTLIAKYTRSIQQRRLATTLSCIALIALQLLVWGKPETRFLGLAVATGLMLLNAFNLRRTIVTVIHLGFALSLIASIFSSFIDLNLINIWYWLLIGSAAILGLYQLRLFLIKTNDTPKFDYISQRTAHGILGVGVETKNFKLINNYIKATDYWAIALIAIELTILSIIYIYVYLSDLKLEGQYFQYLLTTGLLTGAILWRYRTQPHNLVLSILVWLGELFAFSLVMLFIPSNLIFATTNIILGLLALVIIRWQQPHSPWRKLNLSSVPLVYAVCGILWRLQHFNSFTGLLTLGAALILINTPQKNKSANTIINYLGLAAISAGVYELIIYQMQLSTGGSVADGITILALVSAAIAFSYRLGAWWYRQHNYASLFNLDLSRIILVAHLHWVISSILKIIAASIAIEGVTPRLTLVSITTSFFLGIYAVIQGKEPEVNTNININTSNKYHDWWVYVGLVEIFATLVYSRLIISKLSLFDPWRIIFTCAIALLIYQIPWQNLGWRVTPWQHAALIIPALMTLVTVEDISYLSLIVTALFYLRIAYAQKNIRWSYISLGFINWLTIKFLWQYNPQFIWVAAIISLSILYVAQFDSYFQAHRLQRHYLRLLGSSILCTFALFEQPGIIPGVISFSLIFLGLGLQIRAFLFTGTITLILTAIYQLIILVLTYSFLKWVVGLLAGICSIAIAAGFEKQRDQALKQLKNYSNKLQKWQ